MSASVPLAFLSILAEAGFTWGGLGERLLTVVAAAGLTGLITVYALKAQLGALKETVGSLAQTVETHGKSIVEIKLERMDCEMRSTASVDARVRDLATRGEFAQVLVESVANNRQAMDRIEEIAASFRNAVGKVHSRADGLAERVTRVEEKAGKGPEHV